MYVKLNQVNHPLLCGGKTPGLYLREIPSVVGALPVVESGRERSGFRCLTWRNHWRCWELDRVGRAKCLGGLPERDPS